MSRNSKQTKKKVLAKQFTTIRKGGGHGPAKTTPKHNKKATYNAIKKSKRPVVAKPALVESLGGVVRYMLTGVAES